MSKSRHIYIRGERRDPPDLRKLSRALLLLAQAQAEADAQAEHERGQAKPPKQRKPRGAA